MIAHFHAKAIREIRGASLSCCYNHRFEKAQEFAKTYGCEPHQDLESMLDRKDLDIVCVCTPSGAHMEPAVAAARAGKHLLIEKPLEVTLKRCDAILDACQKYGVQLATIFPSRFHESSMLLKKAADTGRFGPVAFADAYVKWFRTQEYYDSGAWRGTWKLDGGGALMNQAIHSVDLLQWIAGPVKEVTAVSALRAHERIEVEDTICATLKFESGALGVIQATTAAYPGALKRIEISGPGGSVVLEEEDLIQWNFAKSSKSDQSIREAMAGQNETGGGASDPAAIGHEAHRRLFVDFLKSIRKSEDSGLGGHEGRKSVELILAIYQSAKTGKAVTLPLRCDPRLSA